MVVVWAEFLVGSCNRDDVCFEISPSSEMHIFDFQTSGPEVVRALLQNMFGLWDGSCPLFLQNSEVPEPRAGK